MNCDYFDKEFGTKYGETNGNLRVSIHYLQYAFNLSDEYTDAVDEAPPNGG